MHQPSLVLSNIFRYLVSPKCSLLTLHLCKVLNIWIIVLIVASLCQSSLGTLKGLKDTDDIQFLLDKNIRTRIPYKMCQDFLYIVAIIFLIFNYNLSCKKITELSTFTSRNMLIRIDHIFTKKNTEYLYAREIKKQILWFRLFRNLVNILYIFFLYFEASTNLLCLIDSLIINSNPSIGTILHTDEWFIASFSSLFINLSNKQSLHNHYAMERISIELHDRTNLQPLFETIQNVLRNNIKRFYFQFHRFGFMLLLGKTQNMYESEPLDFLFRLQNIKL